MKQTHLAKIPLVGLAVCLCIGAAVSCGHAQGNPKSDMKTTRPDGLYFAGLDVFGTDRFSNSEFERNYGEAVKRCVQLLIEKSEGLQSCKQEVSSQIKQRYGFYLVDLSLIQYFESDGKPIYATIDVVEQADASRRASFLPRPRGKFVDPDGLIKSWQDYLQKVFDLLSRGEVQGRIDCPAYHCIFGHQHPQLAPYEKIFVEGVKKNRAQLEKIFMKSQNDEQRASVAFLLAYEKDAQHLVKILIQRLKDENAEVRNNVIRVFSDMASYHPEIALPADAFFDALDFPATTDRNKASAVILGLVSNANWLKYHRQLVMSRGVPILLKMLQLKQPNNHFFAYLILRKFSGQNFGEREYDLWNTWFKKSSAGFR